MTITPLLELIRKGEVGTTELSGYDRMYAPAEAKLGKHKLTAMTLDQVRALQEKMVASRSTSSGGYQFIRATFDETRKAMGLPGSTVWTPEIQDRMAMYLLKKRGLDKFLAGNLSREGFANNLAMEWASLPVVTAIKGQKRLLKPGQSYYSGDGLNKAFHPPSAVLAALDAIKASPEPVPVPPVPDAPPVEQTPPEPLPRKPLTIQQVMGGLIAAAVAAIAAYFFGVSQ